jgi:TetR/AcrR family transcriptional regulator
MDYNSETEQKIIRAATEVFLEKGKDGARMQEIADQAGINKALLHYYFRSKDKLFLTVFRTEFRMMLDNLFQTVFESEDFNGFLRTFVHTYLKNILPRRKLLRFVLWEINNMQNEVADYFLQIFKDHGFKKNPVVLRVEKAITDGQIRNINATHFIMSLLGMCIFPIMAAPIIEKILPEAQIDQANLLQERAEFILELVWQGIKP